MKPTLIYKLLAIALSLQLCSCATSKKTVTAPDGTVTVTEESAPAIKDDTKQFAADVFWAFAPRQRPERARVEPSK